MSLVTIGIPTYEMHGRGVEYLKQNLTSIETQTISKDIRVIISDQSKDDSIQKFLLNTSFALLNISYYRQPDYGNISANFNHILDRSDSEWTKLLFQDDMLYDASSLAFEIGQAQHKTGDCLCNCSEHFWTVFPTMHLKGMELSDALFPYYRNDILQGRNSIGSPSVLLAKTSNWLRFDPNLRMLADCEFYHRMNAKWGPPKCSNRITTISRKWNGQLQNHIDKEELDKEFKYINAKFMYSYPSTP